MDELSAQAARDAYTRRLEVFLTSREMGTAVTLAALGSGIRLETMIAAAADTADWADEALAIVTDEYRPKVHCRSGCNYCCRKPGVLVTIPELLRIVDHLMTARDGEVVRAVAVRAKRYASLLDGRCFNDPINEAVPCPLLVDGMCSVYEVRPLVCRGYNSTDVDACRAACDDNGVLVPIFAMLKDVTDGATVGISQSLRTVERSGALVDLGTALNLALAADDHFSADVAGGAPRLLTAEDSQCVDDLWESVCAMARQLDIDPTGAASR